MKAQYLIVNNSDIIGIIYEDEIYGRVVVFRQSGISIENDLLIHPLNPSNETKTVDMLDMIIKILPS